MRRWFFRILLGIAILIAVILIATQVVLWTDFPRRLVVGLVQQQLGLRVEAKSLSTGWLGHTTLKDVRLSLPLADESFLTVPVMRVSHTALVPLLLTRHLDLKSIEIDKPTLVVRKDNQGRWNVQDAAELLIKSTAGTPQPGTKKTPPKLPSVQLTDGTIGIVDRTGQRATISPLSIKGWSNGPLAYEYDAQVPGRIKVVGQVAPGESFRHEFSFFARPDPSWLAAFIANPPSPLEISGQWAGIVQGDTVSGRLLLQKAQAMQFGARGRVVVQIAAGPGTGNVAANAGDLIAHPQDLIIQTGVGLVPEIRLASGTLAFTGGSQISVQELQITAAGGQAQLSGRGDLLAGSANLHGQWHDLTGPMKIRHGGELDVGLRTVFPNRPQITGVIQSHGQFPQGTWTGEMHLDASGPNWNTLDANLTISRLAWTGRAAGAVENITARVWQRGPIVTLNSIDWPGHVVRASGQFNAQERTWFAHIEGSDHLGTPIQYALQASGSGERAKLSEFSIKGERGVELLASGSYDGRRPKPVDLRIDLTRGKHAGAPPTSAAIGGRIEAHATLDGTASPLNLSLVGTLSAKKLMVLQREVGDVHAALTGSATSELAEFDLHDLQLFGGSWRAHGAWPYEHEDRLTADVPLRVNLSVQDLALGDIGALVQKPGLSGTSNGQWTIDIPLPHLRLSDIAMTGELHAADLAYTSRFHADTLSARTELRNGMLTASPVTLHEHGARGSGSANLSVEVPLRALWNPSVGFEIDSWPIEAKNRGEAQVWAKGNATLDAKSRSAMGILSARARVATTQRSIGQVALEGKIDGRTLALNTITFDGAPAASATQPVSTSSSQPASAPATQPAELMAQGIGGHAQGSATIHLDQPNQSTATLTWSDLDGQRLAELVPSLKGLGGAYAGALTLEPAQSSRALEPLRLIAGLTPSDGHFRSVNIGAMRLSAFLNLGGDFSPRRIVLADLPDEQRQQEQREAKLDEQKVPLAQRPLGWNEIRLAGGRVWLWGRRGEHPIPNQKLTLSSHVIVRFDDLDIEQLLHAVLPKDTKPMPGRVSGQLIAHGDPREPDLLFGQGHLTIDHSDLANIAPLALLYQVVHAGAGSKNGRGSLDLSLQQSALTLQNLRYFNRGVEAKAAMITINDIWKMRESPVEGYLVGTARPLAGIKLPLLADADQILSVLQSNLTTVKIGGTIGDPKVHIASLSDAGDELRELIVGDARKESSK